MGVFGDLISFPHTHAACPLGYASCRLGDGRITQVTWGSPQLTTPVALCDAKGIGMGGTRFSGGVEVACLGGLHGLHAWRRH